MNKIEFDIELADNGAILIHSYDDGSTLTEVVEGNDDAVSLRIGRNIVDDMDMECKTKAKVKIEIEYEHKD